MSSKGFTWKCSPETNRKRSENHWTNRLFGKGVDRYAVKYFRWMHCRCRKKKGRVCAFPRNAEGYQSFIKEMGPIPPTMRKPSVGRIKHEQGYIKGNIRWEETSFNKWKSSRDEADWMAFEEADVPF